jgi:acyl-[acyl-carrier-protein]-phospholipid O-acyltransferase/long-chain-fatty-acid--[acyl-carrier-protein] ligase
MGERVVVAHSDRTTLLQDAIRACRRRRRVTKAVDTTGAEVTGVELLARALVLRRILRRGVLAPDERHVGILVPPTVGAVATNLALALDGRVTVNLNYSLSSELLASSIRQAGIRHVVTSRRFLSHLPLQIDAEHVYLEDLRDSPTRWDKAVSGVLATIVPSRLTLRLLGAHKLRNDDVLTVVFTAGTTGDPKGAELTFGNLAANVAAIGQVIDLRPSDVLLGILPLFHSFGVTYTLWAALIHDVMAAYHTTPLDGRAIGRLCRERKGTILLAPPMFLRTYLRRCAPEDFATLEAVVTGAEKLTSELADAFEARFGIRPVQGYGATEASALIASNVPSNRARGAAAACREETVGRPIPGVRVRAVDLETGAELGPGQPGMLQVRGPNVMKGYLGKPEETAAALRDGWYVTGDIGVVHGDGCVELVGRISRFAKVAGEMVPLVRVEEALAALVPPSADETPAIAVTAVPDPTRGERVVVVHAPLSVSPRDLCRGLAQAGLPNIYLPSPDSFVEVERLPTTGAGKLDLRLLREIALEAFPTVVHAKHGSDGREQ